MQDYKEVDRAFAEVKVWLLGCRQLSNYHSTQRIEKSACNFHVQRLCTKCAGVKESKDSNASFCFQECKSHKRKKHNRACTKFQMCLQLHALRKKSMQKCCKESDVIEMNIYSFVLLKSAELRFDLLKVQFSMFKDAR